jgi:CBL proto-oncogene N-terminus, EF hand-like domain/F-box-like
MMSVSSGIEVVSGRWYACQQERKTLSFFQLDAIFLPRKSRPFFRGSILDPFSSTCHTTQRTVMLDEQELDGRERRLTQRRELLRAISEGGNSILARGRASFELAALLGSGEEEELRRDRIRIAARTRRERQILGTAGPDVNPDDLLSALPPPILVKIVAQLPIREFTRLGRTSRFFRSLCDEYASPRVRAMVRSQLVLQISHRVQQIRAAAEALDATSRADLGFLKKDAENGATAEVDAEGDLAVGDADMLPLSIQSVARLKLFVKTLEFIEEVERALLDTFCPDLTRSGRVLVRTPSADVSRAVDGTKPTQTEGTKTPAAGDNRGTADSPPSSDVASPRGQKVSPFGELPLALLRNFADFAQHLPQILEGVHSQSQNLGEGFDMVDLSLWRHCFGIQHFLSHHDKDKPPTFYLANRTSGSFWRKHFGERYAVPKSEFLPAFFQVLRTELGSMLQTLEDFLEVFLNFPADDVLTIYKFDLLMRNLGPLNCFADNFRKVVLGKGFLGLCNRVRAKELLEEYMETAHPDPGEVVFLIRFSRTAPRRLVVTSVRTGTNSSWSVHHNLLSRDVIGKREIMRSKIKGQVRSFCSKTPSAVRALPLRLRNDLAALAAKDVVQASYCDSYYSES